MAVRNRVPTNHGFTLIEMLLAITIFSMVVVIIFPSFRIGIGSWEKGEKDLEFFQRIRSSADLLFREIGSTYPYKIDLGELDKSKKFYAFFGKPDSLKFVSYAGINKRESGLSLLEIWVDEEKGLMLGEDAALVSNLSALNDIDLRDDDRAVVVCPEAEKIDFRYFDRKRRNEDGEWSDRWNPKDKIERKKLRLPLFVEVMVTFRKGSDEEELKETLIVPIMCGIQL